MLRCNYGGNLPTCTTSQIASIFFGTIIMQFWRFDGICIILYKEKCQKYKIHNYALRIFKKIAWGGNRNHEHHTTKLGCSTNCATSAHLVKVYDSCEEPFVWTISLCYPRKEVPLKNWPTLWWAKKLKLGSNNPVAMLYKLAKCKRNQSEEKKLRYSEYKF